MNFLLYTCFRLTRKSFFVDKKALQNWRFPGSLSQVEYILPIER